MSIYDKYTIVDELIPGLPQTKFDTPNGKAIGIVMHSTANDSDNAQVEGERNYEVNTWQDAFVHTFTGANKIIKTASFDFKAWHACQHGNMYFLGNELAQTTDKALFTASFDRWCWLAARQLFDLKIAPVDNVSLLSHAQVTARWKESTHDDPAGMDGKSGYLGRFGYNWQNVVETVIYYYNAMVNEKGGQVVPFQVQPIHTAPSVIQKGSKGNDVIMLQTDLNKLGFNVGSVDGDFGSKTLEQVLAFQKSKKLTTDGIVGSNTWKALEDAIANLNAKPVSKPAEIKPSTPLNPVTSTKPVQTPVVSKPTPPVQNTSSTPKNNGGNDVQNGSNTHVKNSVPSVNTSGETLQNVVDSLPDATKKSLFDSIVNWLKKLFHL